MKKTAIALGTFDGVHAGHKAVLKAAVDSGFYPIVVAFRLPPKCFTANKNIVLTDEESKTRIIKETGIKRIDYIDFEKVKDLSAQDFFNDIKDKYSPSLIVCGYNYSFGKGGTGNTELLKKLCEKSGISLKVIDKIEIDGKALSSTYIRELLKNGKTEKAVSFLPDGFTIKGEVIHGDKRGRLINLPTINLFFPEHTAAVKFGVYMSSTEIDGKTYFGMTNIGNRPTFPSDKILCETNLFDFNKEIYGKTVSIKLLGFIREEKRFSSLSELKDAVEKDKKEILEKIKKEK